VSSWALDGSTTTGTPVVSSIRSSLSRSLLKNNHYLQVSLVGDKHNTFAIGATVRNLLLIILVIAPVLAAAEDDLLPPDQAFKFSVAMVEPGTAEIHYRIADGYYMYRDKFRFTVQPAGASLGQPHFPAGKVKEDEYFGKVETYRHEVAIRVPVSAASGESEVTLQAISQGCADAGLCYSPYKQSARLVLAATETGTRVTESYDVERPLPKAMNWITEKWVGSSDRDADLRDGMQVTLARIKAAAEQ